jgi:anti-anti-sigma factor
MNTSRKTSENLNQCPACGGEVNLELSVSDDEVPCAECGRVLWFVRKPINDVVLLTFLPGLLSGSESARRVDEVFSAVGDSSRVVLNLARLRVVSSMFLGMLAVLRQKTEAAGVEMKLCGVAPAVLDVLNVAKMDGLFDICDDEQAALGDV